MAAAAQPGTYGDYLQSLLREATCGEPVVGRLHLAPDEAVALEKAGGGYALSLKVDKVLCFDVAMLTTGNAPPYPPLIRTLRSSAARAISTSPGAAPLSMRSARGETVPMIGWG